MPAAPNPGAPMQQPPNPANPYDFIFNPQLPSKKPSLIAGGGSTTKRVLVAVTGLVILVILAAVLMSVLKGAGPNFAPMTVVLQEQTELIRVSAAGQLASNNQDTLELATAVQLSMISAEQQVNTYLAQNKQKVNPALLGLKQSKLTDTELANAQANSTYDTTFTSIIQNDLASYQEALRAAYKADPGVKGRKLMNTEFGNAALLIQQSKQQS